MPRTTTAIRRRSPAGVAASRNRYFRLIDLCPSLCSNQLRHLVVAGDAEVGLAELFGGRRKET
jgi:hypothetical protein